MPDNKSSLKDFNTSAKRREAELRHQHDTIGVPTHKKELAQIAKDVELGEPGLSNNYQREMITTVQTLEGMNLPGKEFAAAVGEQLQEILNIYESNPASEDDTPEEQSALKKTYQRLFDYARKRSTIGSRARTATKGLAQKARGSLSDTLGDTQNILGKALSALIRPRDNKKTERRRDVAAAAMSSSQSAFGVHSPRKVTGDGDESDFEGEFGGDSGLGGGLGGGGLGGGGFGDGQVLVRLVNIEDILHEIWQLADASNERGEEDSENARRAEEDRERDAEQAGPEERDTSPERVGKEEVEKKEGGIFSTLWEMLGAKGKLVTGLGLLIGAVWGGKKLWEWLSGDEEADSLINKLGTTLKDGFVSVAEGILCAIKEKIGTVLSSLDWQEALRLSLPVAAATGGIVNTVARTTAGGIDLTRKAAGGIKSGVGAVGRFLGFGKQAPVPAPSTGPIRIPAGGGAATLEGLSNPAMTEAAKGAAKESTKGASLLSKITGFATRTAGRAPGALRALGTGAKVLGRWAPGLAVAADIYSLSKMKDDNAKWWKRAAIGLGIGAMATAAIVGTGGLAAPAILAMGLGAAGTSIMGSRKEEEALAAAAAEEGAPANVSPSRIRDEPKAINDPSDMSFSDKEAYLHEQLAGAGYSHDQAEGIIENLRDESGLREGVVGDTHLGEGEEALGIAQWRLDRKEKMLAYAEQHEKLDFFQAQVGFLIKELKETRGGGTTGSPKGMPKSYAGAHNWVLQHYERPHKDNVQARWVEEGTSAPRGAMGNLYAGRMAVDTVAPARNAGRLAAGPDAANEQAPAAAAAVNYNDNRVTNNHANVFHQLPNAQNPDASLREAQYQQGLTVAPA